MRETLGMLTFNAADAARVVAGEITVTWRLWKHAHVTAGRTYAFGPGSIEIEEVRRVEAREVRDEDAREVGLPDRAALFDLVGAHNRVPVTPETLLHRVWFRYHDRPFERPTLSHEELVMKLERLDRTRGPGTIDVLRLLAKHPGLRARGLAAEIGAPLDELENRVWKLKALGLVLSAEVGYELSPRGQAFLDTLDEEQGAG
jgi:hypothetical protein